jgi:hypothetical protein
MRAAIPTDLLLRLMNATPEQYAAVERVLASVPMEAPEPVELNVAQAAFALLAKLDAEGIYKKPSPLTVFRLYCIEGLSADLVAAKCRCAKGTIMARLRFIETQTKTKPEQFRAMSAHLQELADNYDRSGAREIYRRGLTGSAPDADGDFD